jgi:hypothetical protein
MYSFGAGVLIGTNTAANSTPQNFGTLQEVSLDFSFAVKELTGSYQFPVAIARGVGKIAGKAKAATLNGAIFNSIFFGQTLATGSTLTAYNEVGTITTNTVTVANAATFVTDLGVYNSATGLPLTKVASAPTTGQYSVVTTTGVYTFAAADSAIVPLISYTYTSATLGKKMTISNQLIGTTPIFSAAFTSTYLNKQMTFTLNQCTASKLNFATKLEDFVIPEFDFSVFADASGTIGTMSFAE